MVERVLWVIKNGDCGGSQREVHEIARKPVRDSLDRGTRLLRPFNCLDDLAKRRIATEALDANLERSRLIDRASVNTGTSALLNWHRFAGDRRLVNKGMPTDYLAVNRDPCSRTSQNVIADGDFKDGNILPFPLSAYAAMLGSRSIRR